MQLQTVGDYPGSGASVNSQFCIVEAPPIPPSTLAPVNVNNIPIQRTDDGLVSFSVRWFKPEILNGNAIIGPTYQLWIGLQPLDSKDIASDFPNQLLIFESNTQVSNSI